jgi:formylglycine-generating enzyme required for sulfatase activity
VWEWCDEVFGTGSDRIYRGGGWFGDSDRCRASTYSWSKQDFRCGSHGFRVVRVPSQHK